MRRRTFKSVFPPRIAPAQRVGDAHKEHGRIAEGGSQLELFCSCGDGGKLKAHLAGRSGEVFQAALVIGHFMESKEAQIKWGLASNESPDNSGQLVSRGGNGFRSTQPGA